MSRSILDHLRAINETAAFNRWAGFEVVSASTGQVDLAINWREDFGQYAGFLHAGLTGALIDTACGYAAVTQCGAVLASHYGVNMIAPAVGERFIARGRVIKPGRRQIFTATELFAIKDGVEKLVATGDAILVPMESQTGRQIFPYAAREALA